MTTKKALLLIATLGLQAQAASAEDRIRCERRDDRDRVEASLTVYETAEPGRYFYESSLGSGELEFTPGLTSRYGTYSNAQVEIVHRFSHMIVVEMTTLFNQRTMSFFFDECEVH